MGPLSDKRVLLGVTGGIAAYKSAELVRRLRDAGADVRVVMTAGAEAFVAPLTFQALSGHRVHTRLLDAEAEAGMGHIELARWADAVLVAPASADCLARLAAGLADDLLTTLVLATEAPVFLAPAMNRVMWSAQATRDNAATLAGRGLTLLGPGEGGQACGESGAGRMREPAELVEALAGALATGGSLAGRTVMVTAGPTREPVDPVRFLGNRSSGRMGFAVAAAARRQGARVILVAGPVALATPPGCERVDVETAAEMQAAVEARLAGCDIFVATAAVADYRVREPSGQKIKKAADRLQLELVRNPDILASVAARAGGPFTVGFAAETEDLAGNARAKLENKSLDMVAANRVGAGRGFERPDNALELFWPGGGESLARMAKGALAERLMARVAQRFFETRGEHPSDAHGSTQDP